MCTKNKLALFLNIYIMVGIHGRPGPRPIVQHCRKSQSLSQLLGLCLRNAAV